MKLQILDIEWDAGNREKCQKHGVSLKVVEEVFQQTNILIAPDVKHSGDEERYIVIGKGEKGKPVFVVFTLRDKDGVQLIRPISARYMHDKELQRYGKNFTTDE
jgi:uncharacterized DUF497 family protein